MNKYILIAILLFSIQGISQEKNNTQLFWKNLKTHCGNSYEGEVIEAPDNDDFRGKKLVIHFKKCTENLVKIPFSVGENKSRTFILKLLNDRIQLKHDHRHEDGTSDKVTMYGGTSSNTGLPGIQFFPADQETANLIPYASMNIWWITIDETSYTYNLRRLGTDRLFSIKFDLTKPVKTPSKHWGWED